MSRLPVAARLTLLLVVVAIVAAAVAGLLFGFDRGDAARRLLRGPAVDRMAAILQLADRLPEAELATLLVAASGPTLTVELGTPPETDPTEDDGHGRGADLADGLERRLRDHTSGVFRDRTIRIELVDERPGPPPGRMADRSGGPPDLLPSRRRAVVAVERDAGQWLVFTVPAEVVSPRWLRRTATTALITLLLFGVAAWAVSRWTTRPLADLATASDRLARDGRGEPVPERGAPEMRRAAAAFNRMQERMAGLLAERTRMLGAIAHDLRTVLTRLRLRIESIDDDTERAKAADDLAAVDQMLAEALAFARDVSATETVQDLDLASLVRSACDDLGDAGATVSCTAPERLVVQGRPVALRRMLDNLLRNAVTYGGRAEVTLALAKDQALLRVADRGPGIPEDQREAVFEPFRRLETSRSRDTGGTGLGLAVARAVARAHGGDVRLEARDGGGLVAVVALAIRTR